MSDEPDDPGDELQQPARPLPKGPLRPICPGCGYDLSGTLESPQRRCPECGREWTIDELALQHVQQVSGRRSPNRFFEAVSPGLTIAGLLLVGLIFGPPVTWLTIPVAVVLAVIATVEWGRDAHRRALKQKQNRLSRLVYVALMTALFLAGNAVVVALLGLLMLLAVTSCSLTGSR
ncbi:MAG: hypothetical protein IT430_07450 [Phycisphaerales bacterium]|nr:hypothetical protein [Phycisphaerales bacterium]